MKWTFTPFNITFKTDDYWRHHQPVHITDLHFIDRNFPTVLRLNGSFRYNTLCNIHVSIGLWFSKEDKNKNNEEVVIGQEDSKEAKSRKPLIR